ncbi:hypothetical protein Y032_0017g3349 [Ancylostoma ceylanicum]|uniref:Uncharacterized protein n=1 Tax=Ancylostoma ceylanicum TaxID=53326 RepID=A0A016V5Z4_9BILA|nr:hypothetical protein Y032_0017g3349 [Ancylostoma ceylanicum]
MCYRIPISRDSSVGSLSDAVKEEGRRGPIPHECLTANASLGVGDETELIRYCPRNSLCCHGQISLETIGTEPPGHGSDSTSIDTPGGYYFDLYNRYILQSDIVSGCVQLREPFVARTEADNNCMQLGPSPLRHLRSAQYRLHLELSSPANNTSGVVKRGVGEALLSPCIDALLRYCRRAHCSE